MSRAASAEGTSQIGLTKLKMTTCEYSRIKKLNTKKIFWKILITRGRIFVDIFTKLAVISQLHCPNAFNIARIVALVLTNILIPNIAWAGLGVTCCIPLKSAESSKNRQFWRKFPTFFSKSSVIVLKIGNDHFVLIEGYLWLIKAIRGWYNP